METLIEQYWHSMPIPEIFTKLKTSEHGITLTEVEQRRQIYGANCLPPPKKRGLWIRFISQFNNVLIYVLLVSAAITIFFQHWVDTSVILGVVIINAIVGCIQEGKAEAALEAITKMLSQTANVIRDEKRQTINAKDLVPGDMVILQSGDRVPADLRLTSVKNLQLQEAILTGESNPVDKKTDPVAADVTLADRASVAYSGTIVTYGIGRGVVIATGQKTEIGKISELVSQVKTITTPLIKQMEIFGYWLALIIVVASIITFLVGTLVWHDHAETVFMAAISIAVAAIPEGLPPVITITLAIGVTRMAKRRAIIRRLPAVETMGAVSVICTDKTGTLTHNELTVQDVALAKADYQVTGSGYNPKGEILQQKQPIKLGNQADLKELIMAGILCNEAEITKIDDVWQPSGHPVDGALLTLGHKSEIDVPWFRKNYRQTDLIPFATEHKFMATLNHNHAGNGYIFVKGAPEKIFQRSMWQRVNGKNEPIELAFWENKLTELACGGKRVVAIATRLVESEVTTLKFEDVEQLILLGLVGIIDPPREEAIKAIADCQNAGIRVKMITGDHAATARAIAEQVGIHDGHGVLIGADLDEMSDDELITNVQKVDIYARTSPNHKLKLVQALQTTNAIVAMTGDGVNDAPALRQAAIGIAMGNKGTEAAKDNADMVLADDNFVSIWHAIREGRTVYDNIKKNIIYLLPTNVAEAISLMLAILLNSVLPTTAVQILWVNMITAVTLGLALSFEPAENRVMTRGPRKINESILSGFLVWRIILVALLLTSCVFGLFLYELRNGTNLNEARTIAINMLVGGEIVYLLNCRHLMENLTFKEIFQSKAIVIAIFSALTLQLIFTYLPIMQHFFGTTGINLKAWSIITLLSVIVFFLIEIEKRLMRWFQKV